MFSIISADSIILLDRDLLLIDTASSSSERMSKRMVVFFSFLLSQMSSRPMARIVALGSRNGSSANNSKLSDLASVAALS